MAASAATALRERLKSELFPEREMKNINEGATGKYFYFTFLKNSSQMVQNKVLSARSERVVDEIYIYSTQSCFDSGFTGDGKHREMFMLTFVSQWELNKVLGIFFSLVQVI